MRTSVHAFRFREKGQRVLMEVAQPAAVPTVLALIRALRQQPRCQSAHLLCDPSVRSYFSGVLAERRGGHGIMEDIPGPFDAAIACTGPAHAPTSLLLYSAKSVFGCRKLFFIASGSRTELLHWPNKDRMDGIDAYFVDDELAAEMFRLDVPWADPAAIIPVGNPHLEEVREWNAKSLRRTVRDALDLPEKAKAIFYIDFPDDVGAPDIGTETLRAVLEGAGQIAREARARSCAILLKKHPRSSIRQESAQRALYQQDLPPNLRVIDAQWLSYEDAVLACDAAVCSPASTFPMHARYWGRTALVCAFAGEGMTGDLFRHVFPPEKERILRTRPEIVVVHSVADVVRAVARRAKPFRPEPLLFQCSVSSIIDRVLA